MCCLTPWKGGFLGTDGSVSCSGLQPKVLTGLQDVRGPESRVLKSLVGCDIHFGGPTSGILKMK